MAMESLTNFTKSTILPSFFTPTLKPLPALAKDFQKELNSFLNLDQHSELPPRAKLYHYIISSAKIKRPFGSTMILLVGGSGVGKSSTINHLLYTGEGVPVALTSASESETKSTSEYVLTVDESSLEVCDLNMSVIDTPGFNDTVGVNQDACNFVSIKRFFETHPKLPEQPVYPNIVFLVVSAMDQRIKGPNSNLGKCLRGIELLKVVDTSRPNLVVVLSFCCSVPHKNVTKWEEKLQQKKDAISNVVYEVLGVQAPVVLIENQYHDQDLQQDGDFTLLPNGERQPKNLYNACLELLEQNKDRFGLMVFNSFFKRNKKNRPTNGHEVEAKDSCVKSLSDEEEEFSNVFSKAAKGGLDPLTKRAMEYIEEKKLGKSQQEEVLKLAKSMNYLGLSDEARLQPATIGEINYVHGEDISEHGIEMLEQKFGIKNESSSLNSAEFVGQGYDIIADKSVPAQIMTFSAVDDTKFGFTIPACAQIVKVNETREYQMDFKSDESYMKSRLQNLGLNVDLAQTILRMAPRFGASTSCKNNGSGQSTKTTKSSLTEHRIAKINIGNFESKEISFTRDFLTAVKELPDRYTDEENTKQKLKRFFDRFGHFVITSAYVGGAVEVKTCGESLERSKHDEESIDGSAGATISGVIGFKASGKNEQSTKSAKNAVLDATETRWQGGRSNLHTKSTLLSEEKMLMWKASLSKHPTLLTTEMSLEPISSVVAITDKTKGEVCYQALCNLFPGNDLHRVRNRQDERALDADRKIQEDRDRRREESNSREGSTKEPDTEGVWEFAKAHIHSVGGAIVLIVAGAVAIGVFNVKPRFN